MTYDEAWLAAIALESICKDGDEEAKMTREMIMLRSKAGDESDGYPLISALFNAQTPLGARWRARAITLKLEGS